MKKPALNFALILAVVLTGAAGCSKKEIDPAKLRAALQTLPGDGQTELERGITAMNSGDYSNAVRSMQTIGLGYKLNSNQRKIVVETVHQLKIKAAATKK